MEIPYEKLALENGLSVVLHADRSAPIVSVYVVYHVGSSREEPGRSGFAHLFEHMLFQGSAHVEAEGHFRRIEAAGGNLNGSTNQDVTRYFETLPSNALELALWLEADRMGFLLPAMTQEKLDNQREVVKNERRQSYENRPYGRVHETVLAALFPAGHPYSWPTIGSMEDIEAATLDDVARFFRRWYGPNNATLAIGGDFEREEALAQVRRWFGDLPRGPASHRPRPWPAHLESERRVVLEDRVLQPQVSIVWPTVEAWHPDEPALALLAEVLSANRSALLDRVLQIEEHLASHVTIAHVASERAGRLQIDLRPHADVSLERLLARADELIAGLAADGVEAERVERLKARMEGALLRGLEGVAARTQLLALNDVLFDDPGRFVAQLERYRAVTPEDVRRAAERYLVGRPRVLLSVVPAGRRELALPDVPPATFLAREPTPRAEAPAPGPTPRFQPPPLALRGLDGGGRLASTPFHAVPITRLSIALPGGREREPSGREGLALLAAEMLEEGTRGRSADAWTDAIDALGASLRISLGEDELGLELCVPDARLEPALALVRETLREPRLGAAELERRKRERLVRLATRRDRGGELADDAIARLVHGPEDPRGRPLLGTEAAVAAATLGDVRAFWELHLDPSAARVAHVGASDPAALAATLGDLVPSVPRVPRAREEPAPAEPARPGPRARAIHVVDRPGAPQSELRVGHLGLAQGDPEAFRAQTMNAALGGSFVSRLNLNLRERHGYTYGVRSRFTGSVRPGLFVVATAVETRFTAAALAELLAELERLGQGFSEVETRFVREQSIQSLLGAYASTAARLRFADNVLEHGFPPDYPLQRLAWLEALTAAEMGELARRHVRPDELAIVVVGDLARIEADLAALERGPLVVLAP